MRLFVNTNYTLSCAAGENLYLNDYEPEHNDYVPNVIYTDMFNQLATTKVLSVGNKRHNAYLAYINHGAHLAATTKREVTQDYATTRRVVFFAVFKNVPFECGIDAYIKPGIDTAHRKLHRDCIEQRARQHRHQGQKTQQAGFQARAEDAPAYIAQQLAHLDRDQHQQG